MELRAIIFDFNGVIVDDEHIHLRLFRKVLEQAGIDISDEEYREKYLPMGDWDFFRTVLADHKYPADEQIIKEFVERKSKLYQQSESELKVFPGVVELVEAAAQRFTLAIASGALRSEIESILEREGIRQEFEVIVSGKDVEKSKPDPECFCKALERINEGLGDDSPTIRPQECLVIEDSKAGIDAAKELGARCLAVSNSYLPDKLAAADLVVGSLEGCDLDCLEQTVKRGYIEIALSGMAEPDTVDQMIAEMNQLDWHTELDRKKGRKFWATAEIKEEDIRKFVAFIGFRRRGLPEKSNLTALYTVYSMYDRSNGQDLLSSTIEEETHADEQARLRTPNQSRDAKLAINT